MKAAGRGKLYVGETYGALARELQNMLTMITGLRIGVHPPEARFFCFFINRVDIKDESARGAQDETIRIFAQAWRINGI